MGNKYYRTYKEKIALIYRYLYNQETELEKEQINRQNYYFNYLKKNEYDFFEDIILSVKVEHLNKVKNDIYSIMSL